MSFFESIRTLDKKFAWSFVGVVLALLFGGIAIYLGFFYERRPNLRFEVISNTAVLDVHENVGKLDILFAGNNIKESNQSLRIITLRVINDGQVDILKSFYDDIDPVGFVVVNGAIVDNPELLHASNDYLGKNLKLNLESSSKVIFSNVILEPNEFYTIKLLVLSQATSIPDITPTGKVAGVKAIQVTHVYQERNDESFLHRAFVGTALVHIVRLISYGLVFLTIVIALMTVAFFRSEWAEKRRRKRLLSEFQGIHDMNRKQGNALLKLYVSRHGPFMLPANSGLYLLELQRQLSSKYLSDEVKFLIELRGLKTAAEREHALWERQAGHEYVPLSGTLRRIRELLDLGFVREEDKQVLVEEDMKAALDRFIEFLQSKNELSDIGLEPSVAHIYKREASIEW